MRVLIEYYKFNTLIEGKAADKKELEKMFKEAVKLRNSNYDGFAQLFCNLFDFKIVKVLNESVIKEEFDYILDIDTDSVIAITE